MRTCSMFTIDNNFIILVVVTNTEELVVASPWQLSPIPGGTSWCPRIAFLTQPEVSYNSNGLQLAKFSLGIESREHDDHTLVGH